MIKKMLLILLINSFGVLFSMDNRDEHIAQKDFPEVDLPASQGIIMKSKTIKENSLLSQVTKLSDIQNIIVGYCKNEWSLFISRTFTYGESEKPAHIKAMTISPDGRCLAISVNSSHIFFIGIETGIMFGFPAIDVSSLDFSNCGKYLATGLFGGKIQFLDLDQSNEKCGKCIKILERDVSGKQGHNQDVKLIKYSPQGKYLASGSYDIIIIWDINGNFKTKFNANQLEIGSFNYSNDDKQIVVGLRYGRITIWDIETSTIINSFHCHNDIVTSVIYSPDGKYLASSGINTVKILHATTYELLHKLTDQEKYVKALSFCQNGKYLTSGSGMTCVKIWDMDCNSQSYGTCVKTIDSYGDVQFLPYGFSIVSQSGNIISIWKNLEEELNR